MSEINAQKSVPQGPLSCVRGPITANPCRSLPNSPARAQVDKHVDCIHSVDEKGSKKPLTTERVFYTMVLTMSPLARSPASPARPPGLYRCYFTRSECKLLDCFPDQRGASEVQLLRVLLSRTLATCRGENASASQLAALLSAFALMALHLSMLTRLTSGAAGDLPEAFLQILDVIEEVNRLQGVK